MSVFNFKILIGLIVLLNSNCMNTFSFENAWENVTYVPSLSESAQKENDLFNKDSFNEVSYTITRPVDFEDGKVLMRPTFITEILPPQLTSITRTQLNHTRKIYNYEEHPYFFRIPNETFSNIPKSVFENNAAQVVDKHSENNLSSLINNSEKNQTIHENNKSIFHVLFKKKIKRSRELKELTKNIKYLKKETTFLKKMLLGLKNENSSLKKRLKKKQKKKLKQKMWNNLPKLIRKKNIGHAINARNSKALVIFESIKKKRKKLLMNKNNNIFEKMKNINNKLEKFINL